MSPAEPTAQSITVRQTLDLLDKEFATTAAGVGEGRYAFWVGSGISREMVPDVRGMLGQVLEHLRCNIDAHDDDCRFQSALDEALEDVKLTDAELNAIRYDERFETWVLNGKILDALENSYAKVLDVRVRDKAADYMLWNAVDVRATFAGDVEPDCEHLCIAMLIMEGSVADIASINWDGLIEAAVERLSGGAAGLLKVIVDPESMRGQPCRTRLIKFHGCAVLAANNPATYREYLVASQSQITVWPHDDNWAAVRDTLNDLAVRSPTFMVGMSAQDSNIQDIFARAKATMPWKWPCAPAPPAYVFSDAKLGAFHRNLLKCVYRDSYDAHGPEIERGALLPAFGKQVFLALIFHLLASKFIALLDAVRWPTLPVADRQKLAAGLVTLRNRVAAEADTDRLAFIQTFIQWWSRALGLFRDGATPAVGSTYQPLGPWALHEMAGDPGINSSGLPEFAASLGLLGDGVTDGEWNLVLPPEDEGRGAFRIVFPDDPARGADIYFAGNAGAAVNLISSGAIAADNHDVVIVHSDYAFTGSARSSSAAPGRTGHVTTRHVSIRELLAEVSDLANFRKRFREEAVL